MKLTKTQVFNAKPGDREVKLSDGGGLYLLVTATGGKHWRWKYRFNGKEKKMAFGSFPEVGLAEARELHADSRKLLRAGVDPMAQRRSERVEARRESDSSFEAVSLRWHEHWSADKNPDYAADVMIRLTRDIFPSIGHLPLEKVTAPDIVATVKKIDDRGAHEIALRSLQNIGQVFRYAIANGLASRNPAADFKPVDIIRPTPVANMARVEIDELPTLLRKIENYEGSVVTRLAMRLMALTFVRTSELIEGKWPEVNWRKKLWVIPAERMKQIRGLVGTKPHYVPLSDQTIDVLESLYEITGHGELMFPHQWDKTKTMSKNTILEALYRMGYKGEMTGHGFRGVAATVLHEKWKIADPLKEQYIDLQLAHIRRNNVKAAYDHSKHMDQRTVMMQWWADYLDQVRKQRPSSRPKGVAR